jgi:hypothetical protein
MLTSATLRRLLVAVAALSKLDTFASGGWVNG